LNLRFFLGWAYDLDGMQEEAFATWQAMLASSRQPPTADEVAAREKAFRTGGVKGYWELGLTQDPVKAWKDFVKAALHARPRNKKEALATLEEAFEDKVAVFILWRFDPLFDALRSEPEAIELSRKMGFEK